VKFAWKQVAIGAKKVGKSLDDYELVAYMPTVIDDDLDKAINTAREFSKLYLPHSQPGGPLMSHAGVKDEITIAMNEAAIKGDDALLSELITDDMVKELCLVGDKEACIRRLQEMVDAGANTIIAFPVPGTDPAENAKVLGSEFTHQLK
jgi:alkanesulfonate monooxygenase SsuD/methylene tetrahydromethanopterin reductase-like flavin-dependent oxidoreductase (luciferase family)